MVALSLCGVVLGLLCWAKFCSDRLGLELFCLLSYGKFRYGALGSVQLRLLSLARLSCIRWERLGLVVMGLVESVKLESPRFR